MEDIDNGIDLESSMKSLNYEYEAFKPKIVVFGVGGGGINAVNGMKDCIDNDEVELVVANTDIQSLERSPIKKRILIGVNTTRGLGAGSDPAIGRQAAEEDIEKIERELDGANMVFLTAGMGGGTGTGAIPVFAKIAKEKGLLVAAIVTKPFVSEGPQKMNVANDGIRELKKYVDTLIVIPNQNLLRIINQDTTLIDSYKMVDSVLKNGVKGIVDLITKPGYINLDFADLRTVMSKSGRAMMGTGEASGDDRATRALEEALSNPLLDNVSIKGAKAIIINITGSKDITTFEHEKITKEIQKQIDNEYANIITGSVFDDELEDTIRVSIFATGISDNEDDIGNNVENDIEEEDLKFEEENINDSNVNINEEDEYHNYKTTRRAYTRKKIGEMLQEDDDDVFDDDIFDMGEAVKYDEFSSGKYVKQKELKKHIENTDVEYNTNFNTNNKNTQESRDNINNARLNIDNINNNVQKKHSFFGLFSSNKQYNQKNNQKNVVKHNFSDEEVDINIDYYNIPSYLRKKK